MNGDTERKRVATYCRVSTAEQAAEGESLALQRERLRKHAEASDWEVVAEHEDAGTSGSRSENRPGFQALMARAPELDAVMVARLSRFGRNARETLNRAHGLKEAGCAFLSMDDGIDTGTPMGGFFLTVLAAIAELEREQIKERLEGGKMAKWRRLDTIVGHLARASGGTTRRDDWCRCRPRRRRSGASFRGMLTVASRSWTSPSG